MSSDFAVTSIGSTCEISTGFPFKSSGYCTKIKSVKLLRGDNIAQGSVRWDGAKRWNPEALEHSIKAKYSLRTGDVVVAMDRPWIEAGLKFAAIQDSDLPCLLVQRVARLRAGESIDQRFLKYVISDSAFASHILAVQTGTAVPHISSKQIAEYEFACPPLSEQKAIAHILGTLDDKIELNRKTNETLEAMAKALFKSWFVDFDPVRAKAEGRPTGLPAELSDLFPDSFEDSELGEIPSGWRLGTIAASAGEVFDGPHATPKDADSGHIFLGIKNMTGTSLDLSEVKLIGLDDWSRWTRRVEPRAGDIVFTYEAALGLFAVIPEGLTCCLGRRMALIRPITEDATPYFWLHQFIGPQFQKLIEERSIHGATVNRTPLTEFPRYPILEPPKAIRLMFERAASSLWRQIHTCSEQSGSLSALRDALLPKLISGELRIPDAEKLLEEAGV